MTINWATHGYTWEDYEEVLGLSRNPEDEFCESHTDDYLRRFIEYHDGLYDYRHGWPFMERTFGTFWERLNIFEREGWDTRRKAYCLGWVDARIEEEILGIKGMDIRFTRPMPVPPEAWWLYENWCPAWSRNDRM